MTAEVDVLIAGGGLVGATLATALAPTGLSVAVVEAIAPSPAQPSFDDRATAIAASSRDILATLGVWDALTGACPITSIRVSDRGRFGATRLDSARHGVPAFGYVVENRELGDVLWQTLAATRTRLLCPARVTGVAETGRGVDVTLATEQGSQRLTARLLVVAEGANSATREMLGVRVTRDDYDRYALVANIATEKPHDQRAFERFTADGPLAVLPLSGARSNVVWSVSEARAAALRDDDVAFVAALQDAFGYRLGRIRRAGTRHAYPLMKTVARPLHAAHWVLLGNAALSVHPVAGQGLNLGLRDMAALAELIVADRERLGEQTLASYARWRRDDHRRVLTMTDSLVRIFTSPAAPVGALRDAALIAMQIAPPVRRWFARRSMGYLERLPRLARGEKLV